MLKQQPKGATSLLDRTCRASHESFKQTSLQLHLSGADAADAKENI